MRRELKATDKAFDERVKQVLSSDGDASAGAGGGGVGTTTTSTAGRRRRARGPPHLIEEEERQAEAEGRFGAKGVGMRGWSTGDVAAHAARRAGAKEGRRDAAGRRVGPYDLASTEVGAMACTVQAKVPEHRSVAATRHFEDKGHLFGGENTPVGIE